MSQIFLEKLREYLNERCKEEKYFSFGSEELFRIEVPPPYKKWRISGHTIIGSIGEYKDGVIEIDRPGDTVRDYLIKRRYRHKLKKARSKEEKTKICEDFINRRGLKNI